MPNDERNPNSEARNEGRSEKGRRWLRIGLTGAVVMGALFLVWPRGEREPVYQGKKLSEWIRGGFRHDIDLERAEEQEQAVRRIGTNALRFLVKWIESAEAPRGSSIEDVVGRASGGAEAALHNFRWRKYRRAEDAAWAFEILGKDARSAVPELTKLSQSTNTIVRVAAKMALDCIEDGTRINRAGTSE